MMYLMLAGGLIILLLCGDLLVRGAVATAMRLGIPPVIVGLTVVAFGTSAPELFVSVKAALSGAPGIALGNVVGSNIANLLLVLGLPAIIYPIHCDCHSIRTNLWIMVGATVLLVALSFLGTIGFWQGLVFFAMILAYLSYSVWNAQQHPEDSAMDESSVEEEVGKIPQKTWVIALMLIAGVIGLPLGANFIVEGGTEIAHRFGVSDALIGLSIIAIGTSLPELATTMMAAVRKQSDVAIGNVIGSNIFNICSILGITAMVAPLPVPDTFLTFDLWVMLIATLGIVPVVMAGETITRFAGAAFVVAYICFLGVAFEAERIHDVAVIEESVTIEP